MFAGEGVEDRNVVPVLLRSLSGLDEADRVTGLGEAGRYRSAAGAGSDDNVVEVGILWSTDGKPPSERLEELDQRAFVGVGQIGTEVVALVLDEVGAGIECVKFLHHVGRQPTLRGRIPGQTFALDGL